MENDAISVVWYKVARDLSVVAQGEHKHFTPEPSEEYLFWITRSGPHGFFPTPDIYDDPIQQFALYDQEKKPISFYSFPSGWKLMGISTILEFRRSANQNFHIEDPEGLLRDIEVYSFNSYEISRQLKFIRDKLSLYTNWKAYDEVNPIKKQT